MGSTRARRPRCPSDAERARSAAARGGACALVGTGLPGPVVPLVQHVWADGSAALLLADDEPLLELVRAREPSPAMLELTDLAPVDLREPVRGLLWVVGWLWLPGPESARRAALQLAELHPHPRLLDLGRGTTVVRLDPTAVVLSDIEGSAALAPADLAGARPDPFCRAERHWLAHLERAHPEVLAALARRLPSPLRDVRGARVRPLGVDRYGLRLRVETPGRDHDVRLPWERPVTSPDELRGQLLRLAGPGCAGTAPSHVPPRHRREGRFDPLQW
ncbi:MAG TPA: DUF2470 domain-containing protein [Pseudonocardia sp.]|nr:DUF2470 domain-containing protein [Pseudonocardia sp.]